MVVASQGVPASDVPVSRADHQGSTSAWSEELVRSAVELTLTVARMGEADLFGWWGCHGLSPTGRYVLERSFPRTWRSVALEIDLTCAARRHDEATSHRESAVHLLSPHLPFCRLAIAWLAEQKTTRVPDPVFGRLLGLRPDGAKESLKTPPGWSASGKVRGAGVWLGELSAEELAEPALTWQVGLSLAGAYADLGDSFVAPYFDLVP